MMIGRTLVPSWVVALLPAAAVLSAQPGSSPPRPVLAAGSRVLLDAHNAYPYQGRFADRIDRAIATGLPLAIEQDLVWYRDPRGGRPSSIVSHGEPFTGEEPSLDEYFFGKLAPLLEAALREARRETWPAVVLNLDFKTDEPEHHQAVWDVLGQYERFLTTAPRTANAAEVAPLRAGPLLVLTGPSDEQERTFHDRVAIGSSLRLFGAVQTLAGAPASRTNYRRWWNNPWSAVEPEGQPNAGAWTKQDEDRLHQLVRAAHDEGLWIRFYTLNGHDPADTAGGWSDGYNFGSPEAARLRWQGAIRAGVDFVAVDQYEAFSATLANTARTAADPRVRRIQGTFTHAEHERLLERDFEVPPGVDRIDVTLEYADAHRTVIDLGLRGPAGVRGWSGGGPQRVSVATHAASFGYTPGPIEPGRWAVVLGVPNIRPGVSAPYSIRIDLSTRPAWPTLKAAPGWYVGDLHAHSGHSDGRTGGANGGRVKVPPEHVFEAARRAGLDFVALTDHNTASHWADVDRLQPLYPGLLLLHGREITTYRGHLNAFGERRFVDFRLGPARDMAQLLRELRSAGSVLSINHPLAPDDERCMGCGWNGREPAPLGLVQAVEIVNGERSEGERAGWPFWAEMLNRGIRVVAVGGSDEHTPDERSDRRLGTPATVVYARELSEAALLDGIRAGRVYIATRGAGGPAVDFSAAAAGRSYPMGALVPPVERLTLVARVDRAVGQELVWIRNGREMSTARIAGARLTLDTAAAPGDWFTLIVRDAAGPTAFANAMHVAR